MGSLKSFREHETYVAERTVFSLVLNNVSSVNVDSKTMESVNADELVAPAWLNAQFVEEVLKKHECIPELKVLDVKISPASTKSDHYASIMFRIPTQVESNQNL